MKMYTMLLTGLLAMSFAGTGDASNKGGKQESVKSDKVRPTPIKVTPKLGRGSDRQKVAEKEMETKIADRKKRLAEANKIAAGLFRNPAFGTPGTQNYDRVATFMENATSFCSTPSTNSDITNYWATPRCEELVRKLELALDKYMKGQPVPDPAQ